MATSLHCFSCNKELTFPGNVGRRDECPHCRADVHVCKNCEYYDPKVYNECRETQADVVREKDRANFCDYFTPRKGANSAEDKKAALRAAAEALFKKK
ncbi:hypothetical protein [Bdellovibrio bacteriovorus]|uniref:Uncharacterized protein n=1 Tax=Bdellovibrio bacteriovorus str. Tiberius TaxID=1069642 RepID=K7YXY7_BDEBC|nr:hypothetical protein [Bdellovibrio bacteriovorus]AFY01580.1 hypothetical protein Bdt_1893 [Bdellovibrio bacteriovorus str. Tiberius]